MHCPALWVVAAFVMLIPIVMLALSLRLGYPAIRLELASRRVGPSGAPLPAETRYEDALPRHPIFDQRETNQDCGERHRALRIHGVCLKGGQFRTVFGQQPGRSVVSFPARRKEVIGEVPAVNTVGPLADRRSNRQPAVRAGDNRNKLPTHSTRANTPSSTVRELDATTPPEKNSEPTIAAQPGENLLLAVGGSSLDQQ